MPSRQVKQPGIWTLSPSLSCPCCVVWLSLLSECLSSIHDYYYIINYKAIGWCSACFVAFIAQKPVSFPLPFKKHSPWELLQLLYITVAWTPFDSSWPPRYLTVVYQTFFTYAKCSESWYHFLLHFSWF